MTTSFTLNNGVAEPDTRRIDENRFVIPEA
jgi:hypothetical protein